MRLTCFVCDAGLDQQCGCDSLPDEPVAPPDPYGRTPEQIIAGIVKGFWSEGHITQDQLNRVLAILGEPKCANPEMPASGD